MDARYRSENQSPPDKSELAEAAREELERVLSDAALQSPPRRRRMLRYVVEETLAGRAGKLNAVPIAQTVFGRDESFDHQSDPVVRIEAHRLRRDLAVYYAGPGSDNPVRISIPKGHYAARFEWAHKAAAADTPLESKWAVPASGAWLQSPTRWVLGGLGVVAFLFVVGGVVHSLLHFPGGVESQGQSFAAVRPTVMVQPFAAAGEGPIDTALADGITNEIVAILMRFPDFRILAPNADDLDSATATLLGPDGDTSYLLQGSIVSAESHVRVSARLTRTDDDQVIWSETYSRDLTVGSLLAIEAEIAADIASQLGQTYGAVRNDLSARLDQFEPSLAGYACVLRAYHYRRNTPGDDLYQPVQDCLQNTVAEDPEYAEAWAMLALLYNDSIRFGRITLEDVETRRTQARAAASRALTLEPDNVLGLIAMSAIAFYLGDHEESLRYARLAHESNPQDPDALALLAFRLIMRNELDEGAPLLKQAIARSANPQPSYFAVYAVVPLMKGDGKAMLDAAERANVDGNALSYAILAMAYSLLDNQDAASRALKRMNEISPGYDPIARLRVHQASDEIIAAAADSLKRVGWPAANQAGLK